ncbi:MAG: hypothetical protein PHQ47_02095, partial [Candidatus Portnoybacteria bacterium]|nr:hypothetical protein [Candidatus Portnoybacteria bacterium]
MSKYFKSARFFQIAVVTIFATFATVAIVSGTTTIGTNMTTEGTLTVSGKVYASSTVLVTGVSNFYNDLKVVPSYGLDTLTAGTLNIGTTTANFINFASAATVSKFLGPLNASSTLVATGASTFYGLATVTNSSTTLANFGGGTTVSGLLWGTCAVNFGTSLTHGLATTTNCIATGVTTAYKVF